jgi:hypothetical protein
MIEASLDVAHRPSSRKQLRPASPTVGSAIELMRWKIICFIRSQQEAGATVDQIQEEFAIAPAHFAILRATLRKWIDQNVIYVRNPQTTVKSVKLDTKPNVYFGSRRNAKRLDGKN